MPTGYTDKIAEGQTFEEFVTGCMRAFGACAEMRDDPPDAEIPDEFTPSSYHMDCVEAAKRTLDDTLTMLLEDAEKEAANEYLEAVEMRKKNVEECSRLREKYTAMLNQVKKWRPPTQEHIRFKDFMVQQITSSIDGDCYEDYIDRHPLPPQKSGMEWMDARIEQLKGTIEYHTRGHERELAMCKIRSAWVKEIRDTLL